jgi:proteasome assembly chaperone (PAC2) family protein
VLINKLSQVLEIDIDTQELQKKVKEGEKFIKKLEEQSAKATGEASAGMTRNVDELTSYIR